MHSMRLSISARAHNAIKCDRALSAVKRTHLHCTLNVKLVSLLCDSMLPSLLELGLLSQALIDSCTSLRDVCNQLPHQLDILVQAAELHQCIVCAACQILHTIPLVSSCLKQSASAKLHSYNPFINALHKIMQSVASVRTSGAT